METRVERDSRGELRVPRRAYWGIMSARLARRGVQAQRYPRRLLHGVAAVVRAAAMASEDLERLRVDEGEWVAAAAQDLADALLDAEIVVDAATDWHGTALLLNVREVVKNRANELMGGDLGANAPIHPDRHVAPGLDQAALFRVAVSVSVAIALREDVLPRLDGEPLARGKALLDAARHLDLSVLGPDDGAHARIITRLADTLGVDFVAGESRDLGEPLKHLVAALGDDDAAHAARGLAAAAAAAAATSPGVAGVWGVLMVRTLEAALQV